jgi:hypothetical protein
VYGVPLNHESKTEDFLFYGFQSVNRADAANTVDHHRITYSSPLHCIEVCGHVHSAAPSTHWIGGWVHLLYFVNSDERRGESGVQFLFFFFWGGGG